MAEAEGDELQLPPTGRRTSKSGEKKKVVISPGSSMKAVLRSGEATTNPTEGDMVIIHCVIRTLEGVVVESTRREHAGKGIPIRYVLGKSKMLLGLAEGIPSMLKGEVAMFKMKPDVHYGAADCPLLPPVNFPREDELHFEIELIDFFKVKVVSEDLGVVKKVVEDGKGWESPTDPYEVNARRETDKKARKQFKGLFDKKPGEISEVGNEPREAETQAEGGHNECKADLGEDDCETVNDEAEAKPERTGWLSRFWPFNRRFLTSIGLNNCSIL